MIHPGRKLRSPSQRSNPGRLRTALAAMGTFAVLATGCAGGAEEGGATPAPPKVPNPQGAGELTEQDVNAWLDGALPGYLHEAGIAGASVSVVSEGELLTSRGYGYSDVAEGEPVDADETLFRAGSVSKAVTATAVMTLVEQGELDLDTDVDEYLDFEVNRSLDGDITLRHLLSHTAGFEERIAHMIRPPNEEVELRQVVAENPPEQVYEPGTTPAYSNYGLALAAYVVENATGVPFDEYVQENVLEPAGMDSSTFSQPLPEIMEESLSNGYPAADQPPGEFETVAEYPAGSLTTTASDMAEFMRVHMESSQGAGVLEAETVAQMHEPALDEDSLGGLAGGGQMTLGFFGEERNGNTIVSHGGDTNLFHSEMQIYPEENAGIFITLNSSGDQALASHQLRLALAEGFADRYFPGEQADGGEAEPTASEHAAMMEGSYMPSRSVQSNFVKAVYAIDETRIEANEDGTITLVSPETGRLTEYMEVEPWVWREVDGHRTLAVDVVDDEIRAIGTTAFSFLPVEDETQASVTLPVLIGSVVVLLITVASWPIGAFARWKLSLPGRGKAGRWPRALTRAAIASSLLALAGWVCAMVMAMSFVDVPFALLRVFQVLQGLGLLGFIPAVIVLINDIRGREGWGRYIGGTLVLLALLGLGWFALEFGMIADSVSY